MTAYYNENDPFAAAQLEMLIYAGAIAPGHVDTRDIRDVKPNDLTGYTQCHFFAGVGVWSYALRCAGWPDNRPVWTGSCPCQPFSAAGRGIGVSDERHLWPHWQWLVDQCRPGEIYGEQVASKDGRAWFDIVSSDLEGMGYANGAVDLCAAGVGAPHIRQRLWFYGRSDIGQWDMALRNIGRHRSERMADSDNTGSQGRGERRDGAGQCTTWSDSMARRMGDSQRDRRHWSGNTWTSGRHESANSDRSERMADSDADRCVTRNKLRSDAEEHDAKYGSNAVRCDPHRAMPTNGFWRRADWIGCRDDKFRPIEPGTFPLVDGAPARVGRLRSSGNAIVAPAAQAFIEATQGW